MPGQKATAGTDVDDQASWSGGGGFPQGSAPHVPLSLLETLNSGHLGPLDKQQDGLPNPRHRPDLNRTCDQAPVPPLPHPFTVSLSPLDGSGGVPPRGGTNRETAAVPSWPSDAPAFPMSCSTQAAMKQDSLCLLNKGACGSLRWPEKKPPHHPPGALHKHSRCPLHHAHLGSWGTYGPRSTSSGHASQSPRHTRRCTRVDTSCRASPRVQLTSVVLPGWASPDLSPANADPTRS